MNNPAIDIIVPVWNKPVETRNCLVNLLNHSGDARLIMVDNGSDRETEKLLQEFSEGLEERAFLLRNDLNLGMVKALNRGLEKGEAEFLCIVRNTTVVGPGWLDPLMEFARQRPEAGLIVPHLVAKGNGKSKDRRKVCEVLYGSFAAMLISRKVFDAIGGFDEEMDGGVWCLRDYSRRACEKGFFTFSVSGGGVQYEEDVILGSEKRRRENLERSVAEFERRWGTTASFCIVMPKGADPVVVRSRLELLLPAARRGCSFHVVVPSHLHKELVRSGHDCLHDSIVMHPLPLFHTAGSVRKLIGGIVADAPGTTIIAGIDGVEYSGIELRSFAALESEIKEMR